MSHPKIIQYKSLPELSRWNVFFRESSRWVYPISNRDLSAHYPWRFDKRQVINFTDFFSTKTSVLFTFYTIFQRRGASFANMDYLKSQHG